MKKINDPAAPILQAGYMTRIGSKNYGGRNRL